MKPRNLSHRFGGATRILEWLLSAILLIGTITIIVYFAIIARLTFADVAPDYLIKEVDVRIGAETMVSPEDYAETAGLFPKYLEAQLTIPAERVSLYLTHHISTLIGYLITFAAAFQLRQFVRTLRLDHPFLAVNAHRLRCVAWLLLGGGIWQTIARVLETKELARAFPHLDLGLTLRPEALPIMLVLILFIVAEAFALGVKMKEEADLTV